MTNFHPKNFTKNLFYWISASFFLFLCLCVIAREMLGSQNFILNPKSLRSRWQRTIQIRFCYLFIFGEKQNDTKRYTSIYVEWERCTVSFSHLIISTKLSCTYQMVLVYIGWVSCGAGSVCTFIYMYTYIHYIKLATIKRRTHVPLLEPQIRLLVIPSRRLPSPKKQRYHFDSIGSNSMNLSIGTSVSHW